MKTDFRRRHNTDAVLTQWCVLLSGERGWYLCRVTPPSPSSSKVKSRSGLTGENRKLARGYWEIMLSACISCRGDEDGGTCSGDLMSSTAGLKKIKIFALSADEDEKLQKKNLEYKQASCQ